ncbi:MAG: PEP-CTERM sorting domain-containing protein [Gammaproteobacteria bacterium]
MKRTIRLFRGAILLALLAVGALPAHATLLFDNLGVIDANSPFNETRSPASGILARIDVGASNVDINQFGVWGSQRTDGNIRFAIFEANGNRIYNSAILPQVTAAQQWFDSPVFATLTLLANTAYYFGLLSDQQFTYHWSTLNPAFSQGGLSSRAGNIAGDNGNFSNFANPTLGDTCCFVTNATRVFGPGIDVPEPTTVALLGLGVLGFRRRFARS